MKKILINNQIITKIIRVIDSQGNQLGIMNTEDAIRLSREQNLDLIQVTDKAEPPVCKIMDYGKYLYREKRKKKITSNTSDELKGIRLSFKMSEHDLGIRIKLAEKFLKKGHRVKIELNLKGREKALGDFAKEKFSYFIEKLKNNIPIKTEKELKREARGFTMIVSKNSATTKN